MSSPTNPTKKQRALPRVWARFFSLKVSTTFTYQGRRFYKSILPFFTAVDLKTGSREYFAPWTRVQTDVLVRDAKPGGKSSNDGQTHYVGDACPGGHAEWETAGGTTQEQNESREFPKQPNSDNNVSGPTS